jgi:hypothetical protein
LVTHLMYILETCPMRTRVRWGTLCFKGGADPHN